MASSQNQEPKPASTPSSNVLDGLLAKIDDSHLQDSLRSEIERLREVASFGLVFEKHLPETARLINHPVRRNSLVAKRSLDDPRTGLVTAVVGGLATVEWEEGDVETVQVDQLVVVARFGEPIYPGLRPVDRIEEGDDKPFHLVINGENYHALELLQYTHEEKVDVIYADPPYNTGAKDWTYNNDYVDGSDVYRHSKWLSFMERRLILARRLLKPDSTLVVTIDEHEVTRLGVLLEQLFPEADITLVTIVINPKGVTRPGVQRFSRVEEYAYFCFFGDAGLYPLGDDLLSKTTRGSSNEEEKRPRWKGLLRSGSNARRQDRKNMFYPVFIDPDRGAVLGAGDPLPYEEAPDFEAKSGGLTPVWPVRANGELGRWSIGHEKLRELIDKGYVSLGGYDEERRTWALSYLSKQFQEQLEEGVLVVKSYDKTRNVADVVFDDPNLAGRRIKTVWHRTHHDAGVGGTDVVSGLLGGREFSFPKSVYAVRDTLAMLTRDKPDAVILDFFAGSGTTAHAAAMLNAEDGGRRQTILITNNEVGLEEQSALKKAGHLPGDEAWEARGIFYRATKPRIEAAIRGTRSDGKPIPDALKNWDGTPMSDGYRENVEFFELTYQDPNRVERGRAFEAVAPLLWLKSGGVGTRIDTACETFEAPDGAVYAVLFDPAYVRELVREISDREEVSTVFVITDSTSAFQQAAAELPAHVEPVQLYSSYLRSFEVQVGDTA